MMFINPKTDFAFKKIFGSHQSQHILIGFLNSLLYDDQPVIQSLEILDPYQAPPVRGMKNSYLDIKANLDNGTVVIIEMQVLHVEGFQKRILYNAAKAYSTQLNAGQEYPLLDPVIALTITDFDMFPETDRVVSRFVLKEKEYLLDYPASDLELVFVELPKFHTMLEHLNTTVEKWIYFLKCASDLQAVPANLQNVPEIAEAFAVARRANLTPQEIDELDHQAMFIVDQRGAIALGRKLAIAEGREEGEKQKQLEIARNLLAVLDDEAVALATGLAVSEIAALRL